MAFNDGGASLYFDVFYDFTVRSYSSLRSEFFGFVFNTLSIFDFYVPDSYDSRMGFSNKD